MYWQGKNSLLSLCIMLVLVALAGCDDSPAARASAVPDDELVLRLSASVPETEPPFVAVQCDVDHFSQPEDGPYWQLLRALTDDARYGPGSEVVRTALYLEDFAWRASVDFWDNRLAGVRKSEFLPPLDIRSSLSILLKAAYAFSGESYLDRLAPWLAGMDPAHPVNAAFLAMVLDPRAHEERVEERAPLSVPISLLLRSPDPSLQCAGLLFRRYVRLAERPLCASVRLLWYYQRALELIDRERYDRGFFARFIDGSERSLSALAVFEADWASLLWRHR